MTFPSIADGAALRSVLGWLHDAGFPHVHHRVLSIAPLTGLAQARRRWLCVATRTPTPTFAWPTPLPLSRRRVLADVLLPTPKLLHCPGTRRQPSESIVKTHPSTQGSKHHGISRF